jgi:hypothetical protein
MVTVPQEPQEPALRAINEADAPPAQRPAREAYFGALGAMEDGAQGLR